MNVEHVRLSQQAKDHLIALKRYTGIQHWNVLCRWALCTSLAEPTDPPDGKAPSDTALEISWKVFGGQHADVYAALLRHRLKKRGGVQDQAALERLLRGHIHRGVGALLASRGIRL
jgi:DNA sulfur modification protein DndE